MKKRSRTLVPESPRLYFRNVSDRTKRKLLRSRFQGMKQRCYNPNSVPYPHYGGRGIKICDEWLANPNAFIDWAMQNKFETELTIDRIDNDGPYSPENCRLVDWEEQLRNRKSTRFISINGETKSVREWGQVINLSTTQIYENSASEDDEDIADFINLCLHGLSRKMLPFVY